MHVSIALAVATYYSIYKYYNVKYNMHEYIIIVRGNARIFLTFLILVLIGCISQNRQFSVLGLNPQIIFKNVPVVFF